MNRGWNRLREYIPYVSIDIHYIEGERISGSIGGEEGEEGKSTLHRRIV